MCPGPQPFFNYSLYPAVVCELSKKSDAILPILNRTAYIPAANTTIFFLCGPSSSWLCSSPADIHCIYAYKLSIFDILHTSDFNFMSVLPIPSLISKYVLSVAFTSSFLGTCCRLRSPNFYFPWVHTLPLADHWVWVMDVSRNNQARHAEPCYVLIRIG